MEQLPSRWLSRSGRLHCARSCRPTRALPRLFHLRDKGGRHGIDLRAELGGRRAVGVEVEATGAPREDDARHLVWLRERFGFRFAAGVVLHTDPVGLGDRIVEAPIACFWS